MSRRSRENARPPGALVLSLDFELHWGVREKRPVQGPGAESLRGARDVIPRMLELFEEFDVAATWATVGFLFARTREELERHAPRVRPDYRNPALSPYSMELGSGEEDAPLHFAASLVRRIRATPRQEIATHTFSHYYCGEEGQDRAAFRADLQAAREIAAAHGIELRSIVFPRNQHNPSYDDVLLDAGIRAYRGNPRSLLWRFDTGEESARAWKRAGRLMEAYAGGTRSAVPWDEIVQPSGLSDVRASALLRPYDPRLRHLEPLRLRRLRRSLRAAARSGRIFHLWWHPHNFGLHQEENLGFLRALLSELAFCRERFGMLSLSMAEVDERVRGGVGVAGAAGAASGTWAPGRSTTTGVRS